MIHTIKKIILASISIWENTILLIRIKQWTHIGLLWMTHFARRAFHYILQLHLYFAKTLEKLNFYILVHIYFIITNISNTELIWIRKWKIISTICWIPVITGNLYNQNYFNSYTSRSSSFFSTTGDLRGVSVLFGEFVGITISTLHN